MKKKIIIVFLSSIIFPFAGLVACSETSKNTTESKKEIVPTEKDKPFYLTLNSTKADSLSLFKNTREIGQDIGGVNIFCEDDFTTLPNWTMHIGRPNLFANTDFNNAVMSFDEKNLLQRVLFIGNVKTKEKQNEVYNRLKDYLDSNYIVHKSSPFFSKNMMNEVVSSDNEDFYTAYVYQDVEDYRVNDGYITLYKRLIGIVEAPASIRPSSNGFYREYAKIGNEIPEWIDAPDGHEVAVNYYSNSFSNMYDEKCK